MILSERWCKPMLPPRTSHNPTRPSDFESSTDSGLQERVLRLSLLTVLSIPTRWQTTDVRDPTIGASPCDWQFHACSSFSQQYLPTLARAHARGSAAEYSQMADPLCSLHT